MMLTNAITAGTWPPKRTDAKVLNKGASFICEQKTSLIKLDKKPRYKQQDRTTITFDFTNSENAWSDGRSIQNQTKASTETDGNINNESVVRVTTTENRGKETLKFTSSAKRNINTNNEESKDHSPYGGSKISDDFLGVSIDSNVSSVDVFESFDTVSQISTLSQFSESEKIEKYFPTDLSIVKASQNADNLIDNKEAQLLLNCPYDKTYYDFIHGSFSDVSLSEPKDRFRAFGIRDLKSETNLSDLKEHILCAERNKDPAAVISKWSVTAEGRDRFGTTVLKKDPSCGAASKELAVFEKREKSKSPRAGDLLISLSAGYTFIDKSQKEPRNRSKVFSSLQSIDNEGMTMSYIDSLRYIKQRDVETCRASGPGLKDGIAGKKTTFYIFSDKDNAKLLKVYVTGPRLVPPKMEFACLAEGFYSVSYWPERVGWYVVNVLWKGKHISGSPFHVLMLLPKRKVWIKRSDFLESVKA